MPKLYHVKKIISHKISHNVLYYKIQWKGYSSKCNTWEPSKNLRCDRKIFQYYQRLHKKKCSKTRVMTNKGVQTEEPTTNAQTQTEQDVFAEVHYNLILSFIKTCKL